MVLDTLMQQVALGAIGASAAELLHWYALARKSGNLPKYLAQIKYWITTFAMVGLGGLMPALYLEGPSTALLCFHLGAATPVLLQKLIVNAPVLAPAQGVKDHSFREFFSW